MLTRRTAVGAGLAFGSVACAAGFGAYGQAPGRTREGRAIDTLFIDESFETPRQMAALVEAGGRALPVVRIRLEAADLAGLQRVLEKSQAVVGLSSGATLFCLERIAWDQGFRLTGRSQRCASGPGEACLQDLAAFLGGTHPAASPPSLARAYRPSRADGLLHAWVMRRSAGPQFRQGRRDV